MSEPVSTQGSENPELLSDANGGSLDVASILGIIFGPACVLVGQWMEGGDVRNLFQASASLIVIGATMAACMVSFSPFYLRAALFDLKKVISDDLPRPFDLIDRLATYAHVNKKEGCVALQQFTRRETYPTLATGLKLITNNAEREKIEALFDRVLHERHQHNSAGAEVFQAAGGYLPTFGILGAVLGLIHTMHTLADPSHVGEGIATAFVATVYGVGLANLVALPLARKIRTRAKAERLLDRIVVAGILAIRDGMPAAALRNYLKEGAASYSASDRESGGHKEVQADVGRAAAA
jgi:chemotaxis protein MotA